MDIALIEAVREVATSSDPNSQVKRLRKIKNDTVGHALRKELVITHGLLDKLEQLLSARAKTSGKRTDEGRWSIEDETRLQATLILDNLANGGPSFVSPILASNVAVHLFDALDPAEAPPRITIASLRALNSLAASWTLTQLSPPTTTPSPLALLAFDQLNSTRLARLLKSSVHTTHGRQCIDLAAGLIATACTDDVSRVSLTKAGMLEVLASILSDFAVHDARQQKSRVPLQTTHLSIQTIAKVLDAISTIIRNSNYRSYRLLLASSFRRTFSLSGQQPVNVLDGSDAIHAAYKARNESCVVADAQLPKILTPVSKTVSFGSQPYSAPPDRAFGDASSGSLSSCDPLCAWLIHMSRRFDQSFRLAALRLLALENAAHDLDPQISMNSGRAKGRERQLSLLALPVAVKLVQDAAGTFSYFSPDTTPAVTLSPAGCQELKAVHSQACSVLAMLIKASPELQKTAVEAGAIKHVATILRKSFAPVAIAQPMWSAQQQDDNTQPTSPSTQMGDASMLPEIAHTMKARAGALKALAAITQRDDSHRKLVIDQGMVNFLIESLVPMTPTSLTNLSSASVACQFNTVSVIVAACEAASALSRSVSLLRTSLIDAGIAKPILALLRHPDTDVQVAATNVCCNLVLDFSPMRQDLMDAGAIKTLCDHARKSSPALRVSSLWAMKHLILHAPKDIKIAALAELGPDWLLQAISGESSAAVMGMKTPNAAGEQVSILNVPDTGADMELDTPDEMLPDDDGENGHQASAIRSTLKPNHSTLTTLKLLREREGNPALQARQEDIDIQEQALDFVRNLMTGEDAAGMVDHLGSTMSFPRFFDLLLLKLESGPSRAPSLPAARGVSISLPPTGTPDSIIQSIVHILTHISAASSRHKQMLIAQKALLRAWLPHFSHPDPLIRTVCVWTVINLTWIDDQSDREDARRRAMELRALGIEEKVRQLQGDSDLDIRERCKTAVRQLDELLSGAGSRQR